MLWTWKCPVKGCKGHGKKPIVHWRAQFYGKTHMKRIHGNRSIEPIMIKLPEACIELKRSPGTCCPEPSCDHRKDSMVCESCGAICSKCPIRRKRCLVTLRK